MLRRAVVTAMAAGGVLSAATTGVADDGEPRYRDPPDALYREDQPPVLKPAAAPEEAAPLEVAIPSWIVRDSFRSAYQEAGSPRLAVFWNRVFGDGLRDMVADEQLVIEGSTARSAGGPDKQYTERTTDRVVVRAERRRDAGARASPVSEIGEFRFQAGYLQPLIEEGANVVDRAAVMRLVDAERRMRDAATPLDDRQLVETAALKEHADLLIQIALSPSAESETGVFFRVSVTEVDSGRIRATFFHDGTFPALPEAAPKKVWKAVRGGYIQVTEEQAGAEPDVNLELMGRILAEQTMVALTRR